MKEITKEIKEITEQIKEITEQISVLQHLTEKLDEAIRSKEKSRVYNLPIGEKQVLAEWEAYSTEGRMIYLALSSDPLTYGGMNDNTITAVYKDTNYNVEHVINLGTCYLVKMFEREGNDK